ncbi:MAG: 3-dehydroquinate synthase [Candidatus Marinimicrobia bacterium]|nr:3-dehydroquinate synthase [Candidatus Neomarinimicrobiota bacterium]MCF7827926.1 3-dehydroquinate synthase [Candidatus Neomarinimicrobiota bacterium]MCF7879319.1 3-dehydroquinate synthase [Candidatus Neomarinimicrobiota bacterium]
MTKIHLPLGERKYDVHVERGILPEAGKILSDLGLRGKVAVFTSPTIEKEYLPEVLPGLKKHGFEVFTKCLPSGEQTKNMSVVEDLYSQLIEWRFERGSTIIALGGGVVGDISGFVASTFLRGIQYVQIPTTLLSQVDSAIGGKVGVNHPLGKNLIGAVYQPKAVIVDPDLLQTLPTREMLSGFGEIIKFSLIRDFKFFSQIVTGRHAVLEEREPDFLLDIITKSIRIKTNYITEDEFDSGKQRILNFGHTVGHAIEAVAGFDALRHGEAVIKGVHSAVEISENVKLLGSNIATRVHEFLDQLSVPAVNLDVEDVLNRMKIDKKVIDGNVTIVLLKNIGDPIIVSNGSGQVTIRDSILRQAIEHVCR